ncbi:interferon regulatory factor 4-like [Gastrophryne carolinensis]
MVIKEECEERNNEKEREQITEECEEKKKEDKERKNVKKKIVKKKEQRKEECVGGSPEMYRRQGQPLRLRDWLILQIDSGCYPGLRWENDDKTIFRIPWKHAAKQNYIEEEDAALFKAWALYKGKFREGSSRADPSVWKTRLRCALNKSPDFQEVVESNQDSGEPYKLYRIVAEPGGRSYFWLHIRLYYQGRLVTEVTTGNAEGCRIAPQSSFQWKQGPGSPPLLEEISFPPLQELVGVLSPGVHQVLRKLLRHLDKGVLLWVAPEGVFIKRKCQVRVYWNGPLALHKDQPNKLEREKTCKILDTQQFIRELEMFMAQKGPEPQYQIQLCFGEEYPESSGNPNTFITAHVEPVFARELLENAKLKLREKASTYFPRWRAPCLIFFILPTMPNKISKERAATSNKNTHKNATSLIQSVGALELIIYK